MILSRNHLAMERVVDDNGVLQFDRDGGALASNKKVVMALAPVEGDVRGKLTEVVGDDDLGAESVSITPETAKEILKNVPKDRKFKGLLEHVNVTDSGDVISVKTVDEKNRARFFRFRKRERYTDRDRTLRHVYSVIGTGRTICLNRKRLLLMLETMEKVADDASGESPVWISFSDTGDVAIRGWDFKFGRPVVGFMSAYKGKEAEAPPRTDWEGTFDGKSSIIPDREPKRLLRRR